MAFSQAGRGNLESGFPLKSRAKFMVFTHKSIDHSEGLSGFPGYELHRLRTSDLQNFIDLGLPTCAFMHGRPDLSADRLRHSFTTFVREHAFVDDSEIYILVEPGGEHIGQLWLHLTRNRFNGRRELWIWDITIRSDHRRKGLGKQLIEFSKRRASSQQIEELWLLVSSINDAAISLYRSCGLQDLGQLLCFPITGAVRREQLITLRSAILRPLTDADATDLHALWEAASLPFRPHGRDTIPRLRASLRQAHEGGWAAFADNRMAGAALLSFDGRRGWVERLAVHPDYRRVGIAKALVIACMNSLKVRGALVIGALIDDDNLSSRKLFESCGFVHKQDICYYTYRENNDN